MRTFRAYIAGALFVLALAASPVVAGDITATVLATGTTDAIVLDPVTVAPYWQPYFCGFAARETVGSAASIVNIYAGQDATGVLLFSFSLTAGESRSEGPWTRDQCIRINEGLFIDRAGTGSTVLSVYSRKS